MLLILVENKTTNSFVETNRKSMAGSILRQNSKQCVQPCAKQHNYLHHHCKVKSRTFIQNKKHQYSDRTVLMKVFFFLFFFKAPAQKETALTQHLLTLSYYYALLCGKLLYNKITSGVLRKICQFSKIN